MLAALRRIGHAIARKIFPAKPEVIPGKFPWAQPPAQDIPPYGTQVLRTKSLLLYADGMGGVVSVRLPERRPAGRAF
jgi:hypothetical protein